MCSVNIAVVFIRQKVEIEMNTQPKQPLLLKVKYLGPVLTLDGELTKNAQNLIFARNGTGKSFLSRGLRYLDLYMQKKDIKDAARHLVSDEALNGKGEFSLSRGTEIIGMLSLEKSGDIVKAQVPNTIFHVFSEDFVHEELRERSYQLDGEINNLIAVDSDNIKLKDAQDALLKVEAEEAEKFQELLAKFEAKKVTDLNEKAGVNKRLKEYQALKLEDIISAFVKKPEPTEPTFAEILRDLDRLKSLPSEPAYPEKVASILINNINLDALSSSLQRVTSLSSVSEEIKQKIDAHREFYETGLEIVQDHNDGFCPFCEQSLSTPEPSSIIERYIKYFAAEEEKHKSELRIFWKSLENKDAEITQLTPRIFVQKTRYDALKSYIPSKKESVLNDGEKEIENVCKAISAIKHVIEEKAKSLACIFSLPENSLVEEIALLSSVIEGNNAKADVLTSAVVQSDDERKALQRKGCAIFELQYAIDHWNDIETIRALRNAIRDKVDELSLLEKSAPSTDARVRVGETFELLLREFFADKYVFDKNDFILKRGAHEMLRGTHRTLSDGEKTAIAFCYFVASLHRKVNTNSDYRKLFLVFDDPVTSMSYDFVYTIAQVLKNLSISKKGEISVNPGQIDGNKYARPELLILTHSSYFFNISLTNKIVNDNAAFALHLEGATHKITGLNKYVAPFQQQLRDIYEIANGKEPDHRTGNAIRSVLEAVGRFCRPDKTSLTDFISFLAGEEGISLKSVLINSLSHGSYYEETPSPDDLRLACEETMKVVTKYAEGQVEIIRSEAGAKVP